MAPVSEPTTTPPATAGQAASRREHPVAARRLLVVRPVLGRVGDPGVRVPALPRHHRRADRHLLHAARRSSRVGVMLLVAPRLQPLALSTTVPLSLGSMSAWRRSRSGYLPTDGDPASASRSWESATDLIDVYLNVAAQRAEAADRQAGPAMDARDVRARRHHRSARWPARSWRLDIDFRVGLAYAGAGAGRHRDVDVVEPFREERHVEGAQTLFSISALFRSPTLLVPALVVLSVVPDRGIDGRVVGAVPPRSARRVAPRVASMAFVAFASAVLFGRLFASRVLFGMGRRTTILVAGFGSLIGGTIAVAADQVFVVALGFLVLGFTLSAAVPAAFGLVGDSGRGSDERDRRRHHRRLHRVHLEPAAARLDRPELQPPRRHERDRHRDARHHRRRLARTSRRARVIGAASRPGSRRCAWTRGSRPGPRDPARGRSPTACSRPTASRSAPAASR